MRGTISQPALKPTLAQPRKTARALFGTATFLLAFFGAGVASSQTTVRFDLSGPSVQVKRMRFTDELQVVLFNANQYDYNYFAKMKVSGIVPRPMSPTPLTLPVSTVPGVNKMMIRTQGEPDTIGDYQKLVEELAKPDYEAARGAIQLNEQEKLKGELAAFAGRTPLPREGSLTIFAEKENELTTWVGECLRLRNEAEKIEGALAALLKEDGDEESALTKFIDDKKAENLRLLKAIIGDLADCVPDRLGVVDKNGKVIPANLPRLSCAWSLLEEIGQRRLVLGRPELDNWVTTHANGLDCRDVNGTWKSALSTNPNPVKDPAEVEVPADQLQEAIRSTGPGGGVLIEVEPLLLEYRVVASENGAPTLKAEPASDTSKVDAKVTAHLGRKVFRVEFVAPAGVLTSVGPFLSGIKRVDYSRVKNPRYDPSNPDAASEFVIGKSEDSAYSYGVGAYWSAPLRRNGAWGVSWGIAYNLQNELDTSVSGLLGFYWRSYAGTPAILHAGFAVGREKTLVSVRGGQDPAPIGPSEEINTTAKTAVSWFLGVSFGIFGE